MDINILHKRYGVQSTNFAFSSCSQFTYERAHMELSVYAQQESLLINVVTMCTRLHHAPSINVHMRVSFGHFFLPAIAEENNKGKKQKKTKHAHNFCFGQFHVRLKKRSLWVHLSFNAKIVKALFLS